MSYWIRKLFLLELFRGMWLTIRVHFQRHVTVEYPRETVTFSPRFRGVPRLRRDPDTGDELCISCLQCEKICPDRCIYIDAEANPHGKGKLLKQFVIDYERCCFCGLCVDPCPTKPLKAIYMSHDYELADFTRSSFKVGKSELHDGIEIKRYAK